MAFTATVMGEGQLAASKTAVYTVPASTSAYVKFINVFNTNTSNETIIFYINTNGTSRKWRQLVLEANESATLLDDGASLQLEAADIIEAETTTALKVDYVVTGVEET